MKLVRIISRIFIGLVFIFSGFVKAVDPLGSTYKFIDYFNAFDLGFLVDFALPFAIILSSIELILGFALLLGYRMKPASFLLLLFMSFFTFLTLILALTNPVHDCGCFGDALILTNWQTFWKNIFLLTITLIVFSNRKKYDEKRTSLIEWSIIGGLLMFSVLLSVYCYRNLPLIDFRPYSIGTHIPEAMRIPADAPRSEYKTTFIYKEKASGKEKKFNLENYPKDSLIWEFIDAESELISQGYEAPIHDFNVISSSGEDVTNDIIDYHEYTILLIAYDLEKSNDKALYEATRYYHLAQSLPDLNFYAITSSTSEIINFKKDSINIPYDFCLADEISLKTIIRANPGLVILHNGTIIGKWHFKNFPDQKKWNEYSEFFRDFPFAKACDLNLIMSQTQNFSEKNAETVYYYRNLINGNLEEFNEEDLEASDEWVLENTVTSSEDVHHSKLYNEFKITDAFNQDYSDMIYLNPYYSLIFLFKDIYSIEDKDFQQIIKLGGMAEEYLSDVVDIYGVLSLSNEELLNAEESYMAPFNYFHINQSTLKSLNFNNTMALLIKDGQIIETWKDQKIPFPEELSNIDFEYTIPSANEVISSYSIKSLKEKNYKLLIFSLSSGILLIFLLLKIYLKP